MTDLSVVVVNWNTSNYLRRCLRSVLVETSELDLQILVVDNASQDNTLDMLATEFPQVEVVGNRTNVGFAAANNQGIAQAKGRYVVCLNPDTEILDGALVRMVNFLDQHPRVAVVGPKLEEPDGSTQGGAAGYDPSLATVLAYALMLNIVWPRRVKGVWLPRNGYNRERINVDWVAGTCLMVRRRVVEDVGGMDTSYFMYAEDIEWCHRIREARWQVVCLTSASVVHYARRSADQRGKQFVGQNVRSLDTYYRSRYSSATRRLLHSLGAIGFLLRALGYRTLSFSGNNSKYVQSATIMWECAKSSFGHTFAPFGE